MDLLAIVFGKGHDGAAGVFAGIFDGLADAAAGGDHDEIGDVDMADDAGLPAENDVAAGFCRTGNARLRDDDVVRADNDVVADLNEVVDLGAGGDAGGLKTGSVDGGVRADFDVIFDDDDAELLEFGVLALRVGGVAKAAGADDGAGLKDDAVADLAPFADRDMGMEDTVGADWTRAPMETKGYNLGVVADHGVLVDDDIRADLDVFTDFGRRVDHSGRMDAGKAGRVCGGVKEARRSVGMCARGCQKKRTVLPSGASIWAACNESGLGLQHGFAVFQVGEERSVLGSSRILKFPARELFIWIANEPRFCERGQLSGGECLHSGFHFFASTAG